MTTELDKARAALAEAGDTDMDNMGHLRVALAEVDRLTAAAAVCARLGILDVPVGVSNARSS